MEWITNLLQHYPELAIFITLALGFWIGKFKIKKFTLERLPAYYWSVY